VLLDGCDSDLPLIVEAGALTSHCERGLIVFTRRPRIAVGAAAEFGIDTEELRTEIELEQRHLISSLVEAAGLTTKYSVRSLGWPHVRSAIRAAIREECEALVLAGDRRGRNRRQARLWRRGGGPGLEVISVRRAPTIGSRH